ncbi:glycoside hydrolase superfamily [Cyathus striatus]|nr:glycoside hydrolase superfamily [Cyathus striatus]
MQPNHRALDFSVPSTIPDSLDGWWCNQEDEYAFLGFSYEVTACQDYSQLEREFSDIRHRFNGRYVRLYGACDRPGFYDDVVEAAYNAGVGVHALIWFGFDGSDIWKTRRDSLYNTLYSNPKAKFVTRTVQFGSEPLFDLAIDPHELAAQVWDAKSRLSALQMPITVSEMVYGYQSRAEQGGMDVLAAVDHIDAHMLPFFSTQASTGDNAWPIVEADLNWFIDHAKGKKVYFSQNGWPSTTYPGVSPNSPSAVADVANERAYYDLLDSKCEFFKWVPGGGVGWFAHIYSDNQEPGYGIYGTDGNLKFDFHPRTSC